SEGSEVTIENSFNTYNINTAQPSYVRPAYTEPYIADRSYSKPYIIDRTYSGKPYIIDDDKRYLKYDSWSRNRAAEGLFGNSIDNYEVYVQNLDYTGGYFKVVFYFEDYYGNSESEAMTEYIGPRDEEKFVIKKLSSSRYEYRTWRYSIQPITKVSAGNYNYRYTKVYSSHSNKIYFYN
ncbi:MAG: hypothetical protein AABX50_02340, partial [Nanoarchaeota archaeon]